MKTVCLTVFNIEWVKPIGFDFCSTLAMEIHKTPFKRLQCSKIPCSLAGVIQFLEFDSNRFQMHFAFCLK